MPEKGSVEFRWFIEMGRLLAERYSFRWIAVDGESIENDRSAIDEIVVADGDTFKETIDIVRRRFDNPFRLFYAFVRPPREQGERQ